MHRTAWENIETHISLYILLQIPFFSVRNGNIGRPVESGPFPRAASSWAAFKFAVAAQASTVRPLTKKRGTFFQGV